MLLCPSSNNTWKSNRTREDLLLGIENSPSPPSTMPDAVKKAIERAIQSAIILSDLELETAVGLVELGQTSSKLLGALRDAVRCDLLERPACFIIEEVKLVLEKANAFVFRIKKRRIGPCFLHPIPEAALKLDAIRSELDRSAVNVRWLVAISVVDDDIDLLGLPLFFHEKPALAIIWTEVGKLLKGSMRIKSNAAAFLGSYGNDSDLFRKKLIEEGGVIPLLRLLEEGSQDGQVNAATALGAIAQDRESADAMVNSGACAVFVKVLKTGPMRVKAAISSAIANFAEFPSIQNVFTQPRNNVVRLLVKNLVSLQEENKVSVSRDEAEMTAMAAKALWKLARGNPTLCRSIIVSGALRCISALIENGPDHARHYSTMAFMEMSRVAEREADLRRLAFKAADSAARDVVEQMIRIVERRQRSELLHTCLVTLGCLCKTFNGNQTHMIGPLLCLLESDEPALVYEAASVLVKFTENQMQNTFMDAMIREGGIHPIVQVVLFIQDSEIRSLALVLLCRLALYVPDNGELSSVNALSVLRLASSKEFKAPDSRGLDMIPVAMAKLQAYQSRDDNGWIYSTLNYGV